MNTNRLQHLPTPAEVAAAKARTQAERAAISRETGIQFDGDRMVHPHRQARVAMFDAEPKLMGIRCIVGGCLTTVFGRTDEERVARIEAHLMHKHGVSAPEQVA